MSWNVIQPSFASGELSPSLFARVDVAKYHSGAALLRNMFVDYRSGASSRMGTMFMIQAFDSTNPIRLIPFQTSVLTPYVLEFGQFYMRPSSFGNPILDPTSTFNITGVSNTLPAVLTVPGSNWANGDWIFISGMTGSIQYNNRYFQVSVSGSTVVLSDVNGNPIDARAYGAWTGGGVGARVFKVASPYAASDLLLLKFVEVTNVMYLTHPSYPPYTLTFSGPTGWVFTPITFGSSAHAPGTPTITASTTGTANYAYEVTSVDASGQESEPSPPGAITNAVNIESTAGTLTATWAAVPGVTSYNVYKAELSIGSSVPANVAFGFVGFSNGTSFIDSNITPDFTTTPPIANNPFAGGNYPGCCCFFQQRLYYAASFSFPQTFWASQVGNYNNFDISNPTQEDDSLEGTLVSQSINYIKSMVPMPGGLLMLTYKGVWQLSASGGGLASTSAVTPVNAIASPQAYNGANDVPPIVINQDVLYVQAKGSIVRDLQYNIYANIYSGTDISIMANHLFYNYQIEQWAYAEEPFKTVWAVRNDGVLLTLSYIKEQELVAWAHSDTYGVFQSICAVTENNVDAVYVAVTRPIGPGGSLLTFIERIADREFDLWDAEDAWCVDCGLRTGGATPPALISFSGNSGSITITASAPVFTGGMVGQILRAGGGIMTVTAVLSSTQITAFVTKPVVQTFTNGVPLPVGPTGWTLWTQNSVFFGLDHLTGQTVSILADGNVVPQQVVVNGTVTLPMPASKVVVGLPFTVQFQTMPIDLNQENDTIQGKRKKISALTVRCRQTRGVKFGHTFDALSPMKEFNQGQILGSTIPLVTGDERVIMDPLWDVPGQICLQVDDPLPLTLLGVIPEITVGDTGK